MAGLFNFLFPRKNKLNTNCVAPTSRTGFDVWVSHRGGAPTLRQNAPRVLKVLVCGAPRFPSCQNFASRLGFLFCARCWAPFLRLHCLFFDSSRVEFLKANSLSGVAYCIARQSVLSLTTSEWLKVLHFNTRIRLPRNIA